MRLQTFWSTGIILALFLTLAPPAMAQQNDDARTKAAIAAADQFLTLVDAGKYAESWSVASNLFKSQVTQAEWVKKISRLRPIFGAVIKRTVKTSHFMESPPGAPDGEYVRIIYQSSFEKKKDAVEIVTPSLDADGQWRVSGYFMK